MCPSAVQSELLYFFYFLNFSSLCARHRHPAWSGPVSSQRCLHSDGHHLWSGWHRGIPHSVGSHSCFALSSHVCHQRHLRSVICNVSHYSLWVKLPITEVIFLSSMNEVIVSPICVSTNHRSHSAWFIAAWYTFITFTFLRIIVITDMNIDVSLFSLNHTNR